MIIPGFSHKIDYIFKREGKLIYKEVVFFLAESRTKKVTLSEEHSEFFWLEFEKAVEKLNFKESKEVLKKADEFLNRT